MLRIGLTGGVASGKSLVAHLFEQIDVPIVDADLVARAVVEPGSSALAAIVKTFGGRVLDDTGRLDRAALRDRIFDDASSRRTLEEILHPRIRARMEAELEQLARAGHAYAVAVIPLLVETEQAARHDRVLVVDAPASTQLRRLQARDGLARAAAESMLASQAERSQRLDAADDVIVNGADDPSERALADQVMALDRKYRHIARARSADSSAV